MQASAVQQNHLSQARSTLPRLKAVAAVASLALIASPWATTTARADSTDNLRRLLSQNTCEGCDLSQAGLVFANLEEAELSNADLQGANLSRATLSNADLRGANLAGAVLYGANLYNADLTGADLRGADLRGAYLGGVKFEGGNLQGAALQGAIAIPATLIDAKTYQTWAMNEAQSSRHEAAVTYYNQALQKEPKLATAYLGRSFSVSVLGQLDQAISDAEMAKTLFEAEGNQQGFDTAEQILITIDQAKAAAAEWEAIPQSKKTSSSSNSSGRRRNWGRAFTSLFKSVGSLVFKTVF